jgi:hypothetical protein
MSHFWFWFSLWQLMFVSSLLFKVVLCCSTFLISNTARLATGRSFLVNTGRGIEDHVITRSYFKIVTTRCVVSTLLHQKQGVSAYQTKLHYLYTEELQTLIKMTILLDRGHQRLIATFAVGRFDSLLIHHPRHHRCLHLALVTMTTIQSSLESDCCARDSGLFWQ